MSIASQLYRQQAAQQARDVRQMSALSALESEKALERAQASRALDKYSKSADLGQKFGKWGGKALGSTILRGLMLANPATAPFALFAPAIGTALGQALATGISSRGAKKLEDKYGSGYLAGTFGDIEGDVLKSGLARAGLSGLQSGLMAKFAPDMTAEAMGKKGIGKHLKGLGAGDDPGFLKAMIEKHVPEAIDVQSFAGEPDWVTLTQELAPEQIQAILEGESGNIGAGASILEGIYDLGFGSPKFQYELEGGR